MHVHAFAQFVGALVLVLHALLGSPDAEGAASDTLVALWWLVIGVYLFFALRRFYGGRAWKTALKMVVLGLSYGLLASIVVFLLLVATIMTF